jgi:hypothetical protein
MVPQSAFIVWQLRGLVEDVHCYFLRRSADFRLVVERAGERLMEESYSDLRELLSRAIDLRTNLLNVGFVPVGQGSAPSQPGLEPLLLHFVREGTASLHPGPAA